MKKINWKARFQNKTFLVTFLTAIVAFIYQILGMFNIVPSISEDLAMKIVSVIITLLVSIGVVVDPTTPGVKDCDEVLDENYKNE